MPSRQSNVAEGVGWEMVIHWADGGEPELEARALSPTEVEFTAHVKTTLGTFTRALSMPFAELRAALDELERSARELEKLP
jgi:hypothetical protein